MAIVAGLRAMSQLSSLLENKAPRDTVDVRRCPGDRELQHPSHVCALLVKWLLVNLCGRLVKWLLVNVARTRAKIFFKTCALVKKKFGPA